MVSNASLKCRQRDALDVTVQFFKVPLSAQHRQQQIEPGPVRSGAVPVSARHRPGPVEPGACCKREPASSEPEHWRTAGATVNALPRVPGTVALSARNFATRYPFLPRNCENCWRIGTLTGSILLRITDPMASVREKIGFSSDSPVQASTSMARTSFRLCGSAVSTS